MKLPLGILLLLHTAIAHQHNQAAEPYEKEPSLEDLWGKDWTFTGQLSFAKLPYSKCLLSPEETFDIALIGMPFDTAVTYRPGARFGPRALRVGSARQSKSQGYNHRANINPYDDWAKIIDCGDVPVTPMDNEIALKQMDKGYEELLKRKTSAGKGDPIPRLVMLGGDHSIILPALRNLYKKYGKINVIHFDSHLDTWAPDKYSSYWGREDFTHGSMLWMAHEEGLINEKNVHVGLRTRLEGAKDYIDDESQGWLRIHADEVMEPQGLKSIVKRILERIPADEPVYLSVDIDVLDPSVAPATGTTEPGGLLTRELIYIIRQLEELNVVGADLVEVSPSYDSAEITATAGAHIIYEILTNMVKKGPLNLLSKSEDRVQNVKETLENKVMEGIENIQNVMEW